jgi:hypothetical protein
MLLRGEGNTGTFISLSRKRHDCSSLKASRYTPNFAGKDWNPSSPPGISSSRLSCVDRQNPWHDSGTVSGARATAALLTTAFHEQFYSIGWFHFQLGCLSKHWGKAYKDLTLDATDGSTQRWMSTVIFPNVEIYRGHMVLKKRDCARSYGRRPSEKIFRITPWESTSILF